MGDMRTIRLTPHFKLSEFIPKNTTMPAPWILDNLKNLANRLQAIRDLLQQPVYIHSGYRTHQQNLQVNGVENSFHLSGMAADISVKDISPEQVQQFLENWSGGMGLYSTHTHLDLRPVKARWY